MSFLPPMEQWFSGLLPYPELLASQILIICLFLKICFDFARGTGYFVIPRYRLGVNLMRFGWVYLAAMILRYITRMWLRPDQRWTGGCIPIFFHRVLAAFILTLGHHHRNEAVKSHELSEETVIPARP